MIPRGLFCERISLLLVNSVKDLTMKKEEVAEYEELPPGDTPVWRYMSLAKLVALISSRSLFLCRADLLDDPFEGSFSEASVQQHRQKWGDAERTVLLSRWIPCWSFVSCWHASDHESMGLWKIYAESEGSVAVQSTINRLRRAFPKVLEPGEDRIIHQDVNKVVYTDYESDYPDINLLGAPLCYKRLAFEYEREIRVIRQEIPSGPSEDRSGGRAIKFNCLPTEPGREIDVDIEDFIKAVYVAPTDPAWVRRSVVAAMSLFGFGDIPVKQSSLGNQPEISRLIVPE